MFSRREVLKCFAATPVLGGRLGAQAAATLSYRTLGRTGRWVVPLGLGGQASIQWMPDGIDPVDIVVRALELGVNYLDTANAYGAGQANYGQAFARLGLRPDSPDYNAGLRDRLFIASKTKRRYALDRSSNEPTAIDDLRNSLTAMFGDGQGYIPEGAYLDSMQIHQLDTLDEVNAVYEWLDRRGERPADRIGALAGLLDYRDGTNYTGLNPGRRHWIRHIGIAGHAYSSVLMAALQRDTLNIIDTLLVALNANDRRYCAHQYNVAPLAVSRGVGVIAMKAFADGAMYGRPARWAESATDVRLAVGAPGGGALRYAIGDRAEAHRRRRGRAARHGDELLPGPRRPGASRRCESGTLRRSCAGALDHGHVGRRSDPFLSRVRGGPAGGLPALPPATDHRAAFGFGAVIGDRRRGGASGSECRAAVSCDGFAIIGGHESPNPA